MLKRIMVGLVSAFMSIVMFSQVSFAGVWMQDNSGWWYLNDDGTYPTNSWQWIDGNYDGIEECYYFNEAGYLLTNTITPDGYEVDNNGAWIENGVVKTNNLVSNVNSKDAIYNRITPDYSVWMVTETRPHAIAVTMNVENHTNETMIIYDEYAEVSNPGYDGLESSLTLTNRSAEPIDSLEIAPNSDEFVFFAVNSEDGVWYDKNSVVLFIFTVGDSKYVAFVSPNGTIHNEPWENVMNGNYSFSQ